MRCPNPAGRLTISMAEMGMSAACNVDLLEIIYLRRRIRRAGEDTTLTARRNTCYTNTTYLSNITMAA